MKMKLAHILGFALTLALAGCLTGGGVEDGDTLDTDPDTQTPDPTEPGDDGDDTVDDGDGRVSDGLVALYRFDEGEGDTVLDHAGDYDLVMIPVTPGEGGTYTWIPGGGLAVDQDQNESLGLVSSLEDPIPATQITGPCQASDELTVETWARTNSTLQEGPDRVVSLSLDTQNRNFTLGQDYDAGYEYGNLRLRTDDAAYNNNGTPALMSENPKSVWNPAEYSHVVYTRTADGDSVMRLNGNIAAQEERLGSFDNWEEYPLTLFNEATLNRGWTGELYLVAVYCRALSAVEIEQNYQAGY